MALRSKCVKKCNDCHGSSNWKLVEQHRSCSSTVATPCADLCNLVSVRNPTSELLIPELLVGQLQVSGTGAFVDLTGWTDSVIDTMNSFDDATGTFSAPAAGDYEFNVVVNFETSVPLQVDTDLINVPSVEVYDVSTGDKLVGSTFPTNNSYVYIPPVVSGDPPVILNDTSVLGKGTVVISTLVSLVAGQLVRVRAWTNGLTYVPPILPITPAAVVPALPARIVFAPENVDTTLTIRKIRGQPVGGGYTCGM